MSSSSSSHIIRNNNNNTTTTTNATAANQYRYISFDIMHPGLSVRVMGDSNYMLVLDFLSVLTGNDRKKASQTLARVSSKPDTHSLLTLRRHPQQQHATTTTTATMNKNPRKLISFSNAIQLLLVLPKRTVDLQTRRSVAGILADFFEVTPPLPTKKTTTSTTTTAANDEDNNNNTMPKTTTTTTATLESVALKQALLQIEQQTTDLEHKRRQQPLDNLRQCFDLLQKCGPLSENELHGIKRAVSEQMSMMIKPT